MRSLVKAILRNSGVPFKISSLFRQGAQGAWYDPSSLWGASDHLPRRNLLTYTEQVESQSAGAWTRTTTVTSATSGQADVLGGTSGVIIKDANTSASTRSAYATLTLSIGVSYNYIFHIKRVSSSNYYARLNVGNSINSWFNPVTGQMATVGAGVTASISDLGSGWYKVVLTNTTTAATNYYTLGISNADNVSTYTGNTSDPGVLFAAPMVCRTDVIYQSYQKVTDWITEQYAWAASKNVPWLRRNRLTYSEDFSNAVWVFTGFLGFGSGSVSNAIANPVDGNVTADLLVPSTVNVVHRFYNYAGDPPARYLSAYVKPAGYTKVALKDSAVTGLSASFSLVGSGTVIYTTTATSATIEPLANSWYRITVDFGYIPTGVRFYGYILDPSYASGDPNGSVFTGDGTSGVYWYGAQTSLAVCDYQPIGASWEAQYAANAAAAGVALTMYQDSACTTPVTGPDSVVGFLGDLSQGYVLGTEALINGDFSNGTTGWTAWGSTLSATSGVLTVTSTGVTACGAGQAITTIPGTRYAFSCYLNALTAGHAISVKIGTDYIGHNGVTEILYPGVVPGAFSGTFTATTTTTYCTLSQSAASSGSVSLSSVSVRKLPGYHAIQSGATSLKPLLKLDPNGKWYIKHDLVDDKLTVNFGSLPFSNLGPELVTNGGFDSDTFWSKASGASITGGVLSCSSVAAGANAATQSNALQSSPSGKTFLVSYSCTITSGSIRLLIAANQYTTVVTSSGTYTQTVTIPGGITSQAVSVYIQTIFTGTIDNISVKEVLSESVLYSLENQGFTNAYRNLSVGLTYDLPQKDANYFYLLLKSDVSDSTKVKLLKLLGSMAGSDDSTPGLDYLLTELGDILTTETGDRLLAG